MMGIVEPKAANAATIRIRGPAIAQCPGIETPAAAPTDEYREASRSTARSSRRRIPGVAQDVIRATDSA